MLKETPDTTRFGTETSFEKGDVRDGRFGEQPETEPQAEAVEAGGFAGKQEGKKPVEETELLQPVEPTVGETGQQPAAAAETIQPLESEKKDDIEEGVVNESGIVGEDAFERLNKVLAAVQKGRETNTEIK
jgi:hypothetical protein